ncbi:MAG: alkaline phosphatase family protein [Chloroflexota bacterium]|nr:alkaline phosphatase family protein [Chloroflexota bacterium]
MSTVPGAAGPEVATVTVNGRDYRLPRRPTVVFALDGCQPAYLDDGMARGPMPRLRDMLGSGGAYHLGRAQMPTLTNPNNVSIVTGVAPAVHGIPGNHYRAPDGEEVQLVDPSFLRAPTIHAVMQQAGATVLAVTAKDKLRRLLAVGDVPTISTERAGELGMPRFGIEDVPALVGKPAPPIYDWSASHYALEIGLAVHRRLRREGRGLDLLYVSSTDYVQHKEPPGGAMADRFYRRFDELLGEYLDAGFVVGITADHGMNAKQEPDGSPRVHYLEDVLDGAGVHEHHVVLPITDPYVLHHGALGSFAWVHLPERDVERARAALSALPGVEEVYTRAEAAVIYAHPADRIGDLSVASDARTALGKSRAKHDLSLVESGLRSHGGRHEQIVPIVVSHPLSERYAARHAAGVGNRDLHDLLLNGVVHGQAATRTVA